MLSVGHTRDPQVRARGYKVVAGIVIGVFLLLAGRLWHLQVLRGERYYRKTADNFVREVNLPASRGEIRDRQGRVLVDNRPSYDVSVVPRFLAPDTLDRLGKLLKLDAARLDSLRARVAEKRGAERSQPIAAAEDVSRDQMALVLSDQADLPGVSVEASPHRAYPQGELAAHVLGYMNQVNATELASLRSQGYRPGDYIGRSGVEHQWESYLRGKDGFERIVVDARGRRQDDIDPAELQAFIGGPLRQAPEPGDNIVLTIDLDLQRATEQALRRYVSSTAVVIDVRTGRILALASNPSFDPNMLTGHLSHADAERLYGSPYRPMLNKAVREIYFPGSTFKIIPALAALEDGLINAGDKMACPGYYRMPGHTFRCMEVHGKIPVHAALAESCNVFFYRLGEKLGMDRMAAMAHDFGLGVPTGVALPNEAAGFIPTTDWYRRHGGMRIGYALNTAIGQGSTKATVLQVALAYAALANGGDLWVPQLVDRIETPSGALVQRFEPRLRHHLAVRPEHLALVQRALCDVVNSPKGTAWAARAPDLPVRVCGKTGTAQVRKRRAGESSAGWDTGNDHAWFASFAPAPMDGPPEIAVVALAEHGGVGGKVAAPMVMDIYRAYFKKGYGRGAPAPTDPKPTNTAPTNAPGDGAPR